VIISMRMRNGEKANEVMLVVVYDSGVTTVRSTTLSDTTLRLSLRIISVLLLLLLPTATT